MGDAEYRHDTATNVKQLQAWRKLYEESTATPPSCWPGKIKHDGHTISVSDVWFIGHHSNYLDKNMMYLADAEIDETAFNSFFGSSVVEYAKFFSNVFVEGFNRPDELGEYLWGDNVP